MAGPSIVVRILGDVSGLAKSFNTATSAGSSAAKGLHTAFSGVLSTLNSTGVLGPFGDALAGVSASLDQIAGHAKQVGPAMMGIGGALAGIGVGFSALGSKDQAAHQQLQAAIAATGKSYEDYSGQVEEAIKHQEKFGHTSNQTQDALTALTQATSDPAKALQLLNTASDLAAAKHESLSTAATQLGKVYNGNTKLLKEFGITVTKTGNLTKTVASDTKQAQTADAALAKAKQHLADVEAIDAGKKKLSVTQAITLRNAEQAVQVASTKSIDAHKKLSQAQDAARAASGKQVSAVDQLSGKLKGQAAAAADTFGGKIAALKAHFEDAAAQLGQKYGPALTAAGAGMTIMGGAVTAVQGIMKSFSGAAKAASAATDAVAASEGLADAAGLPLIATVGLIVLGVAALIAIGYVLYRNWGTIWGFIKRIIKDVWDWIKSNWPLLLGILTGPIGIAVALIWKYWDKIREGFQIAINAVVHAWAVFWGWLVTIAGAIGRLVSGWWHAISDWFSSALSTVQRIWAGFWGWLVGLAGAVGRVVSGWWSDISSSFAVVIQGVRNIWSAFWGWLTGLPGAIFRALTGMWNFISREFGNMVHDIEHAWSNMTLVPKKVPVIGGLGVGDIISAVVPHLAQGGLITREGLIYAHAGEAITPAKDAGRARGPAVNIETAVFQNGVDVESFMRKAAWHIRTAGV